MSPTHYAPIGRLPASRGGSPNRSSSPSGSTLQMTPDSNSDDDIDDVDAEEDVEGNFEMKSFCERTGTSPSVVHSGEDRKRDESSDDGESESKKYKRRTRNRRSSISTVQSFQLYTPDEERAVVRKFDRRLVPFLALLYMLSFLDRSSAFNALFSPPTLML
jgi:hypothetical protein